MIFVMSALSAEPSFMPGAANVHFEPSLSIAARCPNDRNALKANFAMFS